MPLEPGANTAYYVVDPEFLSNYAGGFDFVNNDADPYDDNGHGTHVAGILAAEKNGYLVAGVAPEVKLFALKILDANGEGDVSNLIVALQWAIVNDIHVVNMSLGTHEVSPALATAVANAAGQGLLMVAASGNVNPLIWQELFFGCPVAYRRCGVLASPDRELHAAEGAVAGALVTGTWSNGASGTASCTTTSAGTCTIQKTKLSKATVASAPFTVTGVTLTGSTYTAAANHDPDGDSNGTTIVVIRPT